MLKIFILNSFFEKSTLWAKYIRFFKKIVARHRASVNGKKNHKRRHTIFHIYCRYYGRYYYRMTTVITTVITVVMQ